MRASSVWEEERGTVNRRDTHEQNSSLFTLLFFLEYNQNSSFLKDYVEPSAVFKKLSIGAAWTAADGEEY